MAPSYAASEPLAAPLSPPAPAEAFPAPIVGLPALEEALAAGLMGQWQRLVAQDPRASFFQSPEWCVPWYRCYAEAFEPHVLVVRGSSGIVGLVPLSVQRDTGELTFASNAMADYRDIVALPAYRAAVVTALIRYYLAGRFSHPLHVGWLDPASDTPALIRAACDTAGLLYTARHQPCWRWFPVEGENLNKRFSRIRTHLNHFKRQGEVSFDRIATSAEWAEFRDPFFKQHSLRQLQAGRPLSFHDPRKQRLYDLLFACPDVQLHVTALRGGSRLLAGHVGVVWRDVLMLGAPSINIEEEHRSPAVILLAWIIQNAASQGLSGFDLTIGESEFKKRLGNQCVELTMMEIYGGRRQYYVDAARARGVAAARRAVAAVAGAPAWERRVKPAAASLGERWRQVGERGVRGAAREAWRWIAQSVSHRRGDVLYAAASGDLRPGEVPAAAAFALHENTVDDLLLFAGAPAAAEAAISACARSYARLRAAGHTLHTLVSAGALTAWCWSEARESPAAASGTESADPQTAAIHGVDAVPAWKTADVYRTLLGAVARQRSAEGAARITIAAGDGDAALRVAAESLGFRVVPVADVRPAAADAPTAERSVD